MDVADAMQRKATDINGDVFRSHCKDPGIKQPGSMAYCRWFSVWKHAAYRSESPIV